MNKVDPIFLKSIRDKLTVYPNWPVTGVNFLDTVALCRDPSTFHATVHWFNSIAASLDVDAIFAADALGFLWATPTAYHMSIPLHVVRKIGKLPGKVHQYTFENDSIEVADMKTPIGSIMIIDDVLASGGTAEAICNLLHTKLDIPYHSMTLAVLLSIKSLNGKERVKELGVNVLSLIDE